jgi:hypothetical protein
MKSTGEAMKDLLHSTPAPNHRIAAWSLNFPYQGTHLIGMDIFCRFSFLTYNIVLDDIVEKCNVIIAKFIFSRMTLVRERGERQKAEEINKQLDEKAKSLEMSARETAEGNMMVYHSMTYGVA